MRRKLPSGLISIYSKIYIFVFAVQQRQIERYGLTDTRNENVCFVLNGRLSLKSSQNLSAFSFRDQ